MRGPYQILPALLSLFLVRVDLTDLFPLKIPVEVLKIYDGDTVQVRHGNYQMRVRLSYIDAPEKGQGWAGVFSKGCLEKELQEKGILTIFKTDIYGRFLGDIDGVSLRLVQKGCAPLYPYAEFYSEKDKFIFLKALQKAKAQHVGLWNSNGFIQPKMWRRISKRNGHRQ